MNDFILKSNNNGLSVGYLSPIRVNCNIGVNDRNNIDLEKNKIDTIFQCENTSPDIMMDLSTVRTQPQDSLYYHIANNHKTPIGTVPIYFASELDSLEKNFLLDILHEQAENGVSFFTLHFTANKVLFDIAKKTRKIPVTSRGGGILLKDMLKNNKNSNVYIDLFDSIVGIAVKYNIAISLGSTFRPAGIIDSCDQAHLEETKIQLQICKELKKKGVNVIIENIGHIDLANLEYHSRLLREFDSPIMPLGPLPTDIGMEMDNIAAAIGASFSAYWKCAHIINSITPIEHISSNIDIKNLIVGIKTAKLVAHIVNLINYKDERMFDNNIYKLRSQRESCLTDEACDRCSNFCPLKIK